MNILERIQGHEDLVRLSQVEQAQLCDELRQFLVSNVAQTGGHLASNLGVVELSVALSLIPRWTVWSLMWATSPIFIKFSPTAEINFLLCGVLAALPVSPSLLRA